MLNLRPVRLGLGLLFAVLAAAAIYASPMPALGLKAALACSAGFALGGFAVVIST